VGSSALVPDVRARGLLRLVKYEHATKQFHHTEHPLMRFIEPGGAWVWCYVDEIASAALSGQNLVNLED
jgi:hypothetical protein